MKSQSGVQRVARSQDFLLGQIHQSVQDLKSDFTALKATLVSRAEFDATKRDIDKIAEANREHHGDDNQKHDKLDKRLDTIERASDRVRGFIAGAAAISAVGGGGIVLAVAKLFGHLV